MKELHLLGISNYSVTVTFDLAAEIFQTEKFIFHPNIALDISPVLPNQNYNFEIKPIGSSPNKTNKIFLATAGASNKAHIFNYFKSNHNINSENYINIIHPSSYVAPSSKIAKGVLIEPQCAISSQTTLEFGIYIKRGVCVGHHNHIGAFTDINPGVTISGNVTIGKGCTIGSGTVIRDNITIGENTIIGMGSVVTKDIPANCIAYGNPCKVIKSQENTETIKLLNSNMEL